MAPRCRVLLERCLDIGRKLCGQRKPGRSGIISAIGRGTLHSRRPQAPSGFELRVSFPVHLGPPAVRSPRRKLARVAPVIQTLDETIYPSKAQRLIERILVLD